MKHTLTAAITFAMLAQALNCAHAESHCSRSAVACGLEHKAEGTPGSKKSGELRLEDLSHDKVYIVLIDKYEDVKTLSRLAGFSGNYGHIEVVYDGSAFGCRPSGCEKISISKLNSIFSGSKFEVRQVDIEGSLDSAVKWFNDNLEGKEYDLFYNNCTDAVVMMYDASGDRTRRVYPVDVKATYDSHPKLRKFMDENDIPMPNRKYIFFPDQFETLGRLVGNGTFR